MPLDQRTATRLARAGTSEDPHHLGEAALLCERERRIARAVAEIDVGAGVDKVLEYGGMTLAAVSEHDRLDQRGPAKVIDVVERSLGCDQRSDHLDMAKMGCRNQRSALVGACNVSWAATAFECEPEHRDIVGHGRNGDDVVLLRFKCICISAKTYQCARGFVFGHKGRDMERRAAARIARINGCARA